MNRKLILVAVVVLIAFLFADVSGNKFRQRVRQDEMRVRDAASERSTVEIKDLKNVPDPVRRYFSYACSAKKDWPVFVKLIQSGQFRLKETDNWVPFEASQQMSASEPSFVWYARMHPLPYVWSESRDLLYKGEGDTIIRLFGAFPLSYDSGRENTLSALVQYLAQAAWVPTSLLPGPHIEWQAIDALSARAVLQNRGYRVSAVFTFNAAGEIVKIETGDRYRNVGGRKEQQSWTAVFGNYQTVQGVRIPTEVETIWTIQGNSFSNARFTVKDVQYDVPRK